MVNLGEAKVSKVEIESFRSLVTAGCGVQIPANPKISVTYLEHEPVIYHYISALNWAIFILETKKRVGLAKKGAHFWILTLSEHSNNTRTHFKTLKITQIECSIVLY